MIEATHLNHMGDDLTVVNAAKVSFAKKSEEFDDNSVRLIKYLAKHKHMSPFGHAFATFHVKAPIFVARQLVKHKFLRWNEVSRRYVDEEPELYTPEVWRGRSADKKQGSEGSVDLTVIQAEGFLDEVRTYDFLKKNFPSTNYFNSMQNSLENHLEDLVGWYEDLIHLGVCPEQARMVLPQSMMTEWWWSGSLDAFSDMCNLRCKSDTQLETRIVADKISDKMGELFPVSWSALKDY
jgi:thymidylate synthase (FAD)